MGSSFLAAVEMGGYISILKTVPVVLILLLWTRLLTWVDKDAPAAHLPREPINMGLLAGLVLGYAGFFLLPGFILGMLVLLLVMGIEAGAYLALRNQKVGLGDLQTQFRAWVKSFSEGKKDAPKVVANTVQLVGKGGAALPPPAAEDPTRPAFDAVQAVLYEPLRRNAEQIDVAPAAGGLAVKYYVDGFPYTGATVDRDSGAGAISLVKSAAGLDVEQRRKPQRGNFKTMVDGRKIELRVDTAGSTAGEYMRLSTDFKTRHGFTIDQLGLSEAELDLMRELIADKRGVVVVSAPKGQGLTSLLYAIIRAHDAFLEHIHTVERAPEVDLEGITQNKLAPNATPADEAKLASWVISQEPDVVVVPRIEDRQTARDLIALAKAGKRAYVGFPAASNFDALAMWRKLVGDDKLAASELRLAINGRVVRKLCMACKVGYVPDPGTLRKLNLDPARVKELFQARTEPLRDQKGNPVVCEFCNDLRFKGRTGVYETFIVDDETRAALAAGGAPSALRAVFRKQKGKYLQEEALALVERGETSVQEVLRVLKPPEGASSGGGGGGAAGDGGNDGGGPGPARPPRGPATPTARAPARPSAKK